MDQGCTGRARGHVHRKCARSAEPARMVPSRLMCGHLAGTVWPMTSTAAGLTIDLLLEVKAAFNRGSVDRTLSFRHLQASRIRRVQWTSSTTPMFGSSMMATADRKSVV